MITVQIHDLVPLALLAMPVALGFLIWVFWSLGTAMLRATKKARNWWRRIRKRPLIGQRIEPSI